MRFFNRYGKMRIAFPAAGLLGDAYSFLTSAFTSSIATNNNLAYLLRRHEIEAIATGADFGVSILPEQLLEEGVRLFDQFSVINYALSMVGIYLDERGNYAADKNYLVFTKTSLHSEHQYWITVVEWWSNLLLRHNEYEGIVVLTWLFTLDFWNVDNINRQNFLVLSSKLQEVDSISEDFAMLNKAILAVIDYHHSLRPIIKGILENCRFPRI